MNFSISLHQLSIAIGGSNTILMPSTKSIFAALWASMQGHWIGQHLLDGQVAFSGCGFSIVLSRRCCPSFFSLDIKTSSNKSEIILFKTMNPRVSDVFQYMSAWHYKCKIEMLPSYLSYAWLICKETSTLNRSRFDKHPPTSKYLVRLESNPKAGDAPIISPRNPRLPFE